MSMDAVFAPTEAAKAAVEEWLNTKGSEILDSGMIAL